MIEIEVLNSIKELLDNFLLDAGIFAPLLACLFIVLEAIIPILPLFVFVSINFIAFGTILGFIISWLLTILGSALVFSLVRKGFQKWFIKKSGDKKNRTSFNKYVNELSLAKLTMIIAMPFTPSFLVNISAGITKISFKKYFVALCIGKIFNTFFWGFIGSNLIDSITNIRTLISIGIMLSLAYILSYVINKWLHLKL